jgi:hypothetical protein
MAMRDRGSASLAARRPPAQTRHLRRGPALVDEDQAFWIEVGLVVEPGLATTRHVRALLLAGVRRRTHRIAVEIAT